MTAAAFTGVVALDGPSGTGKSTVARRLAQRLRCRYLDTGAMYRAATLVVLRAGVDPGDAAGVLRVTASVTMDVSTDPRGRPRIRLDGVDVDHEIRTPEVTAAVSAVSAIPQLRERTVAQQRAIIGGGGIVVEGRDIGTVVWPAARPKVYLTASAQARAARRSGELGARNAAARAQVAEDLQRRDRLDSTRAASPLTKATDAVELDTTDLSIDQVVEELLAMVRGRG